MKKILKALLPTLALLITASCSKHEGFDPLDRAPVSMDNTSWVYVVKDSVPITTTNQEGEEETRNVDCTTTNYLLFETATNGSVKIEIVSKMYSKLNSDTLYAFTYGYNRPNGVVHYTAPDELGYPHQADAPFEVSGRKQTITWENGTVVYDRRLD